MSLSAHVADSLRRHGLERSVGIVAISGGPDSVALAHLCVDLMYEGTIGKLILAHLNHQLRGDESDADEAFVQSLPAAWNRANDTRLSCRTQRINVAEIADSERENLESIARRERYRWLEQLAKHEGAAWIATGHTADDQAETVLFRLLRGSGVLGLGGMLECRPLDDDVQLLRPLLSVRRQALLDYLHDHHIPFRLDSSNRDPRFTRNRLRLELLPQIQQNYNPAIVEVLCGLAQQTQELHAEVKAQAQLLLSEVELPRAGDILVFSMERLQRASANRVREMFRLVWQREGWPMGGMDFAHWNRLADMAAGSCSAADFPGGIRARRVGGVIQIQFPPA